MTNNPVIIAAGGIGGLAMALTLRQIGVVVLGAQHDLERSGAAHEAREVLGGAPSRHLTERRLELAEDPGFARGEAHVAGEHELAPRGAHAALDLGDRDDPARAQVAEQERNRGLAGQLGRFRPVLGDPGDVGLKM